MKRINLTWTLIPTLIALFAVGATAPLMAQSTLSVNGSAYFQANYRVGLSCSWSPVSGAVQYLVKHKRQDACGSATVVSYITSTASSSGAHPNCNPSSCYSKTCEIYALNSSGTVLAQGSSTICETGCRSGNCPDCDSDGVCEAGESVFCSDCISGGGCVSGEPCDVDSECGDGICLSNKCKCI